MWEAVILYALSKCGKLTYESISKSGRKPDFLIQVESQTPNTLKILGDITAPSDSGLHENNPIDFFAEKLKTYAKAAGLDWWLFHYNIPGNKSGRPGSAKIRLRLPKKSEIETIFQQKILPWMHEIKKEPNEKSIFTEQNQETEISVEYCPNRNYGGGNYTNYTIPLSKNKNPLFTALKLKADQLKSSKPADIKLIIACDGGSALMRKKTVLSNGEYSGREIACDFLRQNRSIDAVLLIGISESRGIFGTQVKLGMTYDLVMAPTNGKWTNQQEITAKILEKLVHSMAQHLPQPINTAYNAFRNCRIPGYDNGAIGGSIVSDKNIKISSLTLHRLLAGEISLEEFYNAHDWSNESAHLNPFKRMFKQGKMISGIDIEEIDDTDDDWLSIKFEKDPAISKFHK